MQIHMKKILLLSWLIILATACTNSNKKEAAKLAEKTQLRVIKIKGSETIRPFIEKAVIAYEGKHPTIVIDYTGGGSNLGLMALKQNEADIIFSSKAFNEDDLEGMPKDKTLQTDVLAYDALCVIVNIRNPLNELSRTQLSDIYSGKVKNWKELNGPDMPIQVYSRDIASGSYSFFKDRVLLNENYSSTDINLVHNEEIVNNVRDKANAIGYVGHGNVNAEVKTVKIKKEGDMDFIAPNLVNVKSNTYLLSRELSCMYFTESDSAVKEFVSFLRSAECKDLIQEVGFLNK
jgi:phosphate transport system substrate-binding protein